MVENPIMPKEAVQRYLDDLLVKLEIEKEKAKSGDFMTRENAIQERDLTIKNFEETINFYISYWTPKEFAGYRDIANQILIKK